MAAQGYAQESVQLYGTWYTLEVRQRSKSVWAASGTFKGHAFTGTGRTPSAAATSWMQTARGWDYFTDQP